MLNIVRAWILLSTLLVASGWILSALHQLNRAGYGIIFALAAITFIFWRQKTKWRPRKNFRQFFCKFQKRFNRPAPLLFLALAIMALAAGTLYAPSNGDSLAYRVPRVLHWLGAEQWHWIRTFDGRMNIAGCGFDWLSAPLILFTRTDRCLFLVNFISYLMLPGLIFSVFTRLQVRPRVAWWWIWILSSGWCFVFQASSDVNDSFAAIYALAAVDLALRARETKNVTDLWLSLLAAALLTGAKQTNIPLAFLWVIAIWPSIRLMTGKPATTIAVVIIGLLVSILPTTIFNFLHGGTWLGAAATGGKDFSWNFSLNSPFWGIVGNAFCIPAQNLMPPFFPWVGQWNAAMQRFVATPFGNHFASFEHFGWLSVGAHGVNEGNAGIGLGICIFSLISIGAALRCKRIAPLDENFRPMAVQQLLRVTPWLLLILFMAKVGTYENARQLTPYYAFFFPLFLAKPGYAHLTRRRWWQWSDILLMTFTVLLLLISRSRPLFPAQTLLAGLHAEYPQSKFIAHAQLSFAVRSSIQEQRNYFAKQLPPSERVVGFATTLGSSEPGLWFPLGQRRVEWVLPDDTLEQLRARNIHYIVVEYNELFRANENIQQWADKYHGELIDQLDCLIRPGEPSYSIYLVRLRPPEN
jgi:hypothetical protein